jgi:hypothetical protein
MKYANGYLEKIEYWNLQLNTGINQRNFQLVEKAATKLAYFSSRHLELIDKGHLVPGQVGTIA